MAGLLVRVSEDELRGFIVREKVRVKGCGRSELGVVVVHNVRLARRLEAWVLLSSEGGAMMKEGVGDVPHLSCTMEELTATEMR